MLANYRGENGRSSVGNCLSSSSSRRRRRISSAMVSVVLWSNCGGGNARHGCKVFAENRMWNGRERDGEVSWNTRSVAGLDVVQSDDDGQRRNAVWQPFELERLHLGPEASLRFMFLESLMNKARSGNVEETEAVVADMAAVGLKPGPRTYHGLIVSYTRSGDADGAVSALPSLNTFESLVSQAFHPRNHIDGSFCAVI